MPTFDSGLIALLVVLATSVVWFWRAFKVDIPPSPIVFAIIWFGSALVGIYAFTQADGGAAAVWATGLGFLFLYLVSTGAQKISQESLKVGDRLPAFESVDDTGTPFNSMSLDGKPLLLKFFRGHW